MQNLFRKLDKPLLFMTIIYTILGLVMILSASSVSAVLRYDVSPYYFFTKQLIYVVVSYLFGIFLLTQKTEKYLIWSILYIIGVIILLGLVYSFGIIVFLIFNLLNLLKRP